MTVGIGAGDLRAAVSQVSDRGSAFAVLEDGRELATVRLRVPGEHNVLNALTALAVLRHAGVEPADAAPHLATFSGAARRFQEIGRHDGVLVVDDYAHHPTEIEATLTAAQQGDHGRVIAVFQPHLFSRTRYLQREFGHALTLADEAIVTDIFPAREEPEPGVTGKLIVDAYLAERPGGPVAYLPRLSDVVRHLAPRVRPGDLVLTLGAGDVFRAGEQLLATLAGQGEDLDRRRILSTVPVSDKVPAPMAKKGGASRRRFRLLPTVLLTAAILGPAHRRLRLGPHLVVVRHHACARERHRSGAATHACCGCCAIGLPRARTCSRSRPATCAGVSAAAALRGGRARGPRLPRHAARQGDRAPARRCTCSARNGWFVVADDGLRHLPRRRGRGDRVRRLERGRGLRRRSRPPSDVRSGPSPDASTATSPAMRPDQRASAMPRAGEVAAGDAAADSPRSTRRLRWPERPAPRHAAAAGSGARRGAAAGADAACSPASAAALRVSALACRPPAASTCGRSVSRRAGM